MKRTIFVIFGLIGFLSFSTVFAQQVTSSEEPGSESADAFAIIPNLEAEESKDIEESRTKVIFKANVKNCRIYLNQNFQGLTKLSLNNLMEGFYILRAVKEGYKYQENFVYIERGKEKTFYIELQPDEETQKKLESKSSQNDSASKASPSEPVTAEAEVSVEAEKSVGDIQ